MALETVGLEDNSTIDCRRNVGEWRIQVQCQVPFSGEEAMLRPAAMPGLHVQLFRRLQEGMEMG